MDKYETLMEQQRERARGASKFAGSAGLPAELVASLHATEFKGYERLEVDGCKVMALLKDGKPVTQLLAGEQGVVILRSHPVLCRIRRSSGDSGVLCSCPVASSFDVADTQKLSAIFHGHVGKRSKRASSRSATSCPRALMPQRARPP